MGDGRDDTKRLQVKMDPRYINIKLMIIIKGDMGESKKNRVKINYSEENTPVNMKKSGNEVVFIRGIASKRDPSYCDQTNIRSETSSDSS